MGVWVGPAWPEAGLGTKPPGSPYLEPGRRPGARRGDPSGAPSGQWLPPPPSGAGYKGAARRRAGHPSVRSGGGRRGDGCGRLKGCGPEPSVGAQGSRLPRRLPAAEQALARHKEARAGGQSAPSRADPGAPAADGALAALTHSSVPQLMAEPEATRAARRGRLLPLSSRLDSASKAAATTGLPSE